MQQQASNSGYPDRHCPKGIAEYVYIGGSVNNPGFYPLKNNDDVETSPKLPEASKTAKSAAMCS